MTVSDERVCEYITWIHRLDPEKQEIRDMATELLARREADRWIPTSEGMPEIGEVVQWSHKNWKRVKEGYLVASGRLKVWGGEYSGLSGMKWKQLPPVQP